MDPEKRSFLNESYKGAWAEICARLQSRQNVHLAHLTVVLAFFGYLALETAQKKNLALFASVIPLFTFCVALWSRHNDTTIGILSALCRSCEEYFDPSNSLGLPMFHSKNQQWMSHALLYRRFSDVAFGVACLIAMAPSLALAWTIDSSSLSKMEVYLMMAGTAFSVLIALLSFSIIWNNQEIRKALLEDYKFKDWGGEASDLRFKFSLDGSDPPKDDPWYIRKFRAVVVTLGVGLYVAVSFRFLQCSI